MTKESTADAVKRLTKTFDHRAPALNAEVITAVYRNLLEGERIPYSTAHDGFHLIVRHDDVVAVEKNSRVFSNAKGVVLPSPPRPQQVPIEFDGPQHAAYRKLFADLLNVQRVRQTEPFLYELTEELVENFSRHEAGADFVEVVARPLPLLAISQMLGHSRETANQVAQLAEVILANFGTEAGAEPMRQLAMLARAEIESRREQPRDDYMNTLMHAEIEGRKITDTELEMVIQAFLFAGYETTVHAVGSMMAFLADNPAIQEQLRSDSALIGAVIEESLRLFPPAHTMFRTVTEQTALGDTTMEADDKVVLLFSAANRDPSKFECPEEFRLDRRNPRQHLAFGFGAHFCVGSHLARAEMRILLEVLNRYPCVELAGPPEHTPHLLMGQMMGVEHLPLRFQADA